MSFETARNPELERHLLRMRWTTVLVLLTVPVAVVALFVIPHRGAVVASPMTVTLVAAAAALWIGFTANRDAAARIERIKRAFAVDGDERRLLHNHWLVYLLVLLRLAMMIVCGVVIGLWGIGPQIGVWVVMLGGIMIALTWPSRRKTQLLLGRARQLRDDD